MLSSRSIVQKEFAHLNNKNEEVFPIQNDERKALINENSDDEVVPPSPIKKKKKVLNNKRNNEEAFSSPISEDEELTDDLYVDSDETFCPLAEKQLKKKKIKNHALSPEKNEKDVTYVFYRNTHMDKGEKKKFTINNENYCDSSFPHTSQRPSPPRKKKSNIFSQ